MSSQIDATKPTAGSATTSSVRTNFDAAEKEINDLQKMSTMFNRTAGDGAAYTVSLTDQFETNALVDGARITVEIHTISTSTTPTLTVTAGGTALGAKTIVKAGAAGGSALVAGDLKEDALVELMYVASGGDGITDKFVWLNCASESPNFTVTPTSTTAAVGTNTTQIATTAFALANNGLGVVGQWRLNADVSVGGTSLEPIGGTAGTFEEADDPTYTRVGSAMSYSSGIFTFPETGIYLIIFQSQHEAGANETNFFNKIMVTTGSGYSSISESHTGALSGYRASATCFGVFDVTSTSTHKVRFDITGVGDTGTTLEGSTDTTITGATFIKLANT